MTNLSRFHAIRLLGLCMLSLLSAAAGAQQLPPLAEAMAKTYGLDSFDKVEAIRFTWGIEGKISRTWEWEPKTGKVTLKVRIRTATR